MSESRPEKHETRYIWPRRLATAQVEAWTLDVDGYRVNGTDRLVGDPASYVKLKCDCGCGASATEIAYVNRKPVVLSQACFTPKTAIAAYQLRFEKQAAPLPAEGVAYPICR